MGDQAVINVQTSDPMDEGEHIIVVEVLLDFYGQMLESEVIINIVDDRFCTITGLSLLPGQDLTIEYDITDPPQ